MAGGGAGRVPEAPLSSGKPMPRVGLGTASHPLGTDRVGVVREAVLRAVEAGYRHFDTASLYGSEVELGEAVAEAVRSGRIASRDELFVTSKLWCSDAHADRVLPAIKQTLQNLQMEYVDLYLVHGPMSLRPGKYEFPFPKDEIMPFDMKAVWSAMEQCQRLGLAKAIGVSNFSSKKLETLLSFATIPPAANQVEVNPLWRQAKLRGFCKENGIQLCDYMPLGAKGTPWGSASVMDSEVLQEIATSKGKTVAQVSLRWLYEQGDCVLVKSFNEKRMQENLEIFDWELTDEERHKISQIPQHRGQSGMEFVSDDGPYKSLEEFWDGDE